MHSSERATQLEQILRPSHLSFRPLCQRAFSVRLSFHSTKHLPRQNVHAIGVLRGVLTMSSLCAPWPCPCPWPPVAFPFCRINGFWVNGVYVRRGSLCLTIVFVVIDWCVVNWWFRGCRMSEWGERTWHFYTWDTYATQAGTNSNQICFVFGRIEVRVPGFCCDS